MGDTGERKGSGLKRGHLTRESILREALTLVDEKGFDALSLRTLGKRLGVSQAAFYRHIPDKAALLDGVAEIIRPMHIRLVRGELYCRKHGLENSFQPVCPLSHGYPAQPS